MNRRLLPFFAIILIVLAGLVVIWPRGARLPALPAAPGDTAGFHASDAALIGYSSTPQLVEFFHPG